MSSSIEVPTERLSIKSASDLEFSQSRHVREQKAELSCGHRSAEAAHFFDEHNAECGHYKQTLLICERGLEQFYFSLPR
jgi:hypothetical protein